jgi:hypothetical protein
MEALAQIKSLLPLVPAEAYRTRHSGERGFLVREVEAGLKRLASSTAHRMIVWDDIIDMFIGGLRS